MSAKEYPGDLPLDDQIVLLELLEELRAKRDMRARVSDQAHDQAHAYAIGRD